MGGKGGEKEKKGRRKEERKEVDVGKERCHVITKEKMRWYWYSQWNPALLELLMCWKTEKKEVAWYLLKFIAEFCFCTECLVLTPKIILKMQQNLPCSNEQRKAKTFTEQFIRLRWWSTLVKTRFLAEDGFHCAHLLGRHQLSLIRQMLNAALEVLASSSFALADCPLKCIFIVCLKSVQALTLCNFCHTPPSHFK